MSPLKRKVNSSFRFQYLLIFSYYMYVILTDLVCTDDWTGKYCNIPVCEPSCVNGFCVNPNNCSCGVGWSGKNCAVAICKLPCTSHGNCTEPNICTCEENWHGFTCETPFAPGFKPGEKYFYEITTWYDMVGDTVITTPERKSDDDYIFLSNVSVSLEVTSFQHNVNHSIGYVKITDIKCEMVFGSKNTSDQENKTCSVELISLLETVNISFLQNSNTGKIEHILYNRSDGQLANFVGNLIHFLDYETGEKSDIIEKDAYGNSYFESWSSLKSTGDLQCVDFTRTIRHGSDSESFETKRVCFSPESHGAPTYVTITQNFMIGENEKIQTKRSYTDSENLVSLPSYDGRVEGFGNLISIQQMSKNEEVEMYSKLKTMISSSHIQSTPIALIGKLSVIPEFQYTPDSLINALSSSNPHVGFLSICSIVQQGEEYSDLVSDFLKSEETLHGIFSKKRNMLIAAFGASQTSHGEENIRKLLNNKEQVPGDHYYVLGALAQVQNPSLHTLYSLLRFSKSNASSELITRSILIIGVLGSRGYADKSVAALEERYSASITTEEKVVIISALGNTHHPLAGRLLLNVLHTEPLEYVKRVCIRSLRNIPGMQIFQTVLDSFLKTRNKNMALQCLQTLNYKISYFSTQSLTKLLNFSSEIDDPQVYKNLNYLLSKINQVLPTQSCYRRFAKVNARILNENWKREFKTEAQNFGLYVGGEINTKLDGSLEYDFNARVYQDVKVFGKRFNILEAGSANSYVNKKTFISAAYLTLKLFGKEFDLFLKTWKFDLPFGVVKGDSCSAINGNPKYSLEEHYNIEKVDFNYGIPVIGSIQFSLSVSGKFKLGYGLNVITDDNMNVQQVNGIAVPSFDVGGTLSGAVSALLAKGGIEGSLTVAMGKIQMNIALNIRRLSFCHYIGTDFRVLKGKLQASAEVGVWPLTKSFTKEIFSWDGKLIKDTFTQSICCEIASQVATSITENDFDSENKVEVISHFDQNIRHSRKLFSNLFLLSTMTSCSSYKLSICALVHKLQERDIKIIPLDESIAMAQPMVPEQMFPVIFPVVADSKGIQFALNENGDIMETTDSQGYRWNARFSSLYDLIYHLVGLEREINLLKVVCVKPPPLIQMNVLNFDLSSHCTQMPKVCDNIERGISIHGRELVYVNNENVEKVNKKLACSKFIKDNGIRYPYYCDDYPFSSTLQGGEGAMVAEVNVKEHDTKMKVFQSLYQKLNLKGGETFRVIT